MALTRLVNNTKDSVVAATTGANINLAAAPNTLDGVTLALNNRILVKDQTPASLNGIYRITTLGTGANGSWTRSSDFNDWREATAGVSVFVELGATNGNSFYFINGGEPNVTINTTAINFSNLYSVNANTTSLPGNLNVAGVTTFANVITTGGIYYPNGATAGGSASGGNTMVQFSNSGVFGGATYLQYNYVSGNLVSNSTTTSTSSTTGALVVSGGVGIGGNLYVGGNLSVGGNTTFINTQVITTTDTIAAPTINAGTIGNSGAAFVGATNTLTGNSTAANYNSSGTITINNIIANSGTTSTSTTTGAVIVAGGIGVSRDVYVGGNMNVLGNHIAGNISVSGGGVFTGYFTGAIGANTANTGSFTTLSASSISSPTIGNSTTAYSGSSDTILGNTNAYNFNANGTITVGTVIANSGTSSTSTTTGAIIVQGGVGITGNTNIGQNEFVTGNITIGNAVVFSSSTLAAAGSTQGTATLLTADNNYISSGSGGVILPTTLTGREISITNNTASSINVYPASGASIELLTANTPVTLPSYATLALVAKTSTNWWAMTYVYYGGTDTTVTQVGNGAVIINDTATLATITGRGNTTTNGITISNTTAATSTTTGALIVTGGVGIGGNLYVGGNLSIAGNTTFINTQTITTTDTIAAPTINAGTIGNSGAAFTGATLNTSGNISAYSSLNVVSNIGGGYFVANNAVYSPAYYWANGTTFSSGGGTSNAAFYSQNVAPISPTLGSTWYQANADILFEYVKDAANNTFWLDLTTNPSTFGNITVTNTANIANFTTSGNITGVSSNVTIVAGNYQSIFSNVGNVIVPTIYSTGNLTTTTGIFWANGTAYSSGGGGSGTPSGSNTMVQFNNGGSFGGATYLQYNITSGNLVSNSTTTSTSTTTGALVLAGGLGVGGNINASGNIGAYSSLNVISNIGGGYFVANTGIYSPAYYWANGTTFSSGGSGSNAAFYAQNTAPVSPTLGSTWYQGNTDTLFEYIKDGAGNSVWFDLSTNPSTFGNLYATNLSVTGSNASTSTTSGALIVTGGVGVGGNLNVGGNLTGASSNVTVVAGAFQSIFSNVGNVTVPNIYTSGNIISAVSIIPSSNNTVNLGGSSSQYFSNVWANIFYAGSSILPGANIQANIGGVGSNYFNYIYGVNFVGTSTTAKYADLAEMYHADDYYAPGTVMIFGGDLDVTAATVTHDTRVAGVVSTNPAYLMNDNFEQDNWLPIALTGRVPCNVQGPVNKGDLLVSSDTKGVAQKLDKSLYEVGCIIGKSMDIITDNNIKKIEIAVGRF